MSGQRWPNAILERKRFGITLAYAGHVGLRTLDQHRTTGWQLSWSDEQNDIGLTSFVDVGPTKLPTKCQRRSTKLMICYLGMGSYFIKSASVSCIPVCIQIFCWYVVKKNYRVIFCKSIIYH